MKPVGGFSQQIDFRPVVRAEEEKLPLGVLVEFLFQDVAHDKVLKEIPPKRIPRDLRFRLETQKTGRESRLGEVQLGCLSEALADVGVVGLKAKDDERGLQYVQPLGKRRMADADFARKRVVRKRLNAEAFLMLASWRTSLSR